MNASVLHPPNRWHLSDDVIGNVVLRTRSKPDVLKSSIAPYQTHGTPELQAQTPGWKTHHQSNAVHVNRESLNSFGARDPGFVPWSADVHKAVLLEPTVECKVEGPVQDTSAQSVNVASLIAMGQESLREARRQNQRRYRKKQHDNMISLELETNKLELEIRQLEKRRRALAAVIPGDDSAWSVVVEYFRLFQYGLREQPTTQQQHQSPAVHGREAANSQLGFLRSRLAPDVLLNEGRGVDVAIYSWRRVSFWFQDFRVELEDLHKEGNHALLAVTKTSFTITERTLRNVFPGIWNERESDVGSVLVGKLLNRRIVMRGIMRFEWDSMCCRVATMIAQSDLLTPVLQALGNLKDVERVFGKAVISPDFRWTASSRRW